MPLYCFPAIFFWFFNLAQSRYIYTTAPRILLQEMLLVLLCKGSDKLYISALRIPPPPTPGSFHAKAATTLPFPGLDWAPNL